MLYSAVKKRIKKSSFGVSDYFAQADYGVAAALGQSNHMINTVCGARVIFGVSRSKLTEFLMIGFYFFLFCDIPLPLGYSPVMESKIASIACIGIIGKWVRRLSHYKQAHTADSEELEQPASYSVV